MAENFLGILIDSTRWFIDQDPTTITLVPNDREAVRGPGGGFVAVAGTPRAPARVKLIGVEQEGISMGEGGRDRSFDYTIVGMPDLIVEINDSFTVSGNTFRVTAVLADNGYETKAKAVQLSVRNPTDG